MYVYISISFLARNASFCLSNTFFKKQYIFQILKLFKSSNLQNKMKFVFVIEGCIKRKLEHTYENYINNCGF